MAVDPGLGQAVYGISTLSAVGVWIVLWGHRDRRSARALLASVAGGFLWSTSLFLATLTSDFTVSTWLYRGVFVGIGLTVVAMFVFALEYTGRQHLVTRRTVALLAFEPVLLLFFVVFNPGNLFFRSLSPSTAVPTGVEAQYGPAVAGHLVYSYALVLGAALLIFAMLFRTRALYRGHVVVLVTGTLAPLAGNALIVAELVDFSAATIGFALTNVLYATAVVRYRLIDLSPIARDRIVANVNAGTVVVDTEHRIVDLNPAAKRLLADQWAERTVGADLRIVLSDAPELADLFDEITTAGVEAERELTIGDRHFEITGTPIDDGRDRLAGWLFLVHEVTERVRREQELRRRNEQLDEFAGVVSHDLRNPLAVARGRVDLTRETGDLEHLDAVDDALDRMDVIVDDVLELARQGEHVTDPEQVTLGDVADGAWEHVDSGAADLEVVDTDAVFLADRERLTRALENLFRNACEHGESETAGAEDVTGLSVRVGIISGDAASSGFYVEDDGTGIPEETRHRAFESGYSTAADGTGFGLAIVQEIALAHGWQVELTESDSGGARFEFREVTVDGGTDTGETDPVVHG